MALIKLLASTNGRIARALIGIALMAIGALFFADGTRVILLWVGMIPLGAAIFDVCLFAPLFGKSFKGAAIRTEAV